MSCGIVSWCLYLQVLAEPTSTYSGVLLFTPFEVTSGENSTAKGNKILHGNKTHTCSHTVTDFKHFQALYQSAKDLRTPDWKKHRLVSLAVKFHLKLV